MLLRHTQELMQRKLDQQAFDIYAVLVRKGDETSMFFSPNADGDTLFDIASCVNVNINPEQVLDSQTTLIVIANTAKLEKLK